MEPSSEGENTSSYLNMNDAGANVKVLFDGGFIYTCSFCPKIMRERLELENHLEEDHDFEEVDDNFLDGPMFKVRKIQFYLRQVSSSKYATKHCIVPPFR